MLRKVLFVTPLLFVAAFANANEMNDGSSAKTAKKTQKSVAAVEASSAEAKSSKLLDLKQSFVSSLSAIKSFSKEVETSASFGRQNSSLSFTNAGEGSFTRFDNISTYGLNLGGKYNINDNVYLKANLGAGIVTGANTSSGSQQSTTESGGFIKDPSFTDPRAGNYIQTSGNNTLCQYIGSDPSADGADLIMIPTGFGISCPVIPLTTTTSTQYSYKSNKASGYQYDAKLVAGYVPDMLKFSHVSFGVYSGPVYKQLNINANKGSEVLNNNRALVNINRALVNKMSTFGLANGINTDITFGKTSVSVFSEVQLIKLRNESIDAATSLVEVSRSTDKSKWFPSYALGVSASTKINDQVSVKYFVDYQNFGLNGFKGEASSTKTKVAYNQLKIGFGVGF